MLSILLRLTLVCMIGYGGYRVFREQMTARFCRTEAKKMESRFGNLLIMNSNRVHLRRMKSDNSFCSWLYFAPAGKSFEVQLQSKEATATIIRVPSRSSGHYGLIQIQFGADDAATLSTFKTFEVFGPDFSHYSQNAEKDAMFAKSAWQFQALGTKVDPLKIKAATSPLSTLLPVLEYSTGNQPTHVFCDAHQKALLAYFSEVELTGTAKIKQKDYAVTVSEVNDR